MSNVVDQIIPQGERRDLAVEPVAGGAAQSGHQGLAEYAARLFSEAPLARQADVSGGEREQALAGPSAETAERRAGERVALLPLLAASVDDLRLAVDLTGDPRLALCARADREVARAAGLRTTDVPLRAVEVGDCPGLACDPDVVLGRPADAVQRLRRR